MGADPADGDRHLPPRTGGSYAVAVLLIVGAATSVGWTLTRPSAMGAYLSIAMSIGAILLLVFRVLRRR